MGFSNTLAVEMALQNCWKGYFQVVVAVVARCQVLSALWSCEDWIGKVFSMVT